VDTKHNKRIGKSDSKLGAGDRRSLRASAASLSCSSSQAEPNAPPCIRGMLLAFAIEATVIFMSPKPVKGRKEAPPSGRSKGGDVFGCRCPQHHLHGDSRERRLSAGRTYVQGAQQTGRGVAPPPRLPTQAQSPESIKIADRNDNRFRTLLDCDASIDLTCDWSDPSRGYAVKGSDEGRPTGHRCVARDRR
jgi:hypothetical protein